MSSEFRATVKGGPIVRVSLVNPDTSRWEIAVETRNSIGASIKTYEVPDWQLEDMIRVMFGRRRSAACSLLEQLRRDHPPRPKDLDS